MNLRGILDELTTNGPDNTSIYKKKLELVEHLTAPLLATRAGLLTLSLFLLGYLVHFLLYLLVTKLFYPSFLASSLLASWASFLRSHCQVSHFDIFLLHIISSSLLSLRVLGIGVSPRTAHGYVYPWRNAKAKGLAHFDKIELIHVKYLLERVGRVGLEVGTVSILRGPMQVIVLL